MPIDSALALCISFASSLQLDAPDAVFTNSNVTINATIEAGDPQSIDFVLVWPNGSDNTTIKSDVQVAPSMNIFIPKVPAG